MSNAPDTDEENTYSQVMISVRTPNTIVPNAGVRKVWFIFPNWLGSSRSVPMA